MAAVCLFPSETVLSGISPFAVLWYAAGQTGLVTLLELGLLSHRSHS